MMFWIPLAILILLLIAYLLFSLVELVVDTEQHQYYLKYGRLLRVNLEGDPEEFLRLHLWIMGFHHYYYPLRKKQEKKKKPKKRSSRRFDSRRFRQFRALVRAIRVRRFELEVDSGNCITNAKLYPLIPLFGLLKGDLRVNFQNRNSLVAHLETRPIAIMNVFMNH